MNLIIDAGNTRVKMAVFQQGEMLRQTRLDTLSKAAIQEFIQGFEVNAVIFSSVAVEEPLINTFLNEFECFVKLNHETPLSIKNLYSSPETLGTDRIACAVGAHALFPKSAVLSVDAGTCIKFDMVNEKGEYLGGSISPGLQMRISSLHNFTARLPLLPLSMPEHFIGSTTEESILSGVVRGAIAEVDGLIDLYRASFNNLKVVLSGGDMAYFEKSLKNRIFAAPNLLMQGLNQILDEHAKK
jgi:type III pantothenate kinase